LISQVFAQLAVGGSAHLFGTLRNPIKVQKAVNERGIRVFSGVPSTFTALTMMHRLQSLEMPGVRVVCSAGAPFDLAQYDDIKAIFPNARIFNNYGATEATPRISFVADDDPLFFSGSCGRPIEGLEVVAVDAASRQPLADGEHGIIAVRGANVTAGYLDDEERTATAFLPGGWFVTNDLGWVANGAIHVQGRADDIFDVGGEKVAPGEIEQVLMRLPEVEGCAVVGRADPARGHVPVAFLKLRGAMTKAELNRQLGLSLAPIKIPVRYYRVESFPHTANGKLRRRDLVSDDTEFMRDEIA
jgi:long-chain acyl-CoA synthetase